MPNAKQKIKINDLKTFAQELETLPKTWEYLISDLKGFNISAIAAVTAGAFAHCINFKGLNFLSFLSFGLDPNVLYFAISASLISAYTICSYNELVVQKASIDKTFICKDSDKIFEYTMKPLLKPIAGGSIIYSIIKTQDITENYDIDFDQTNELDMINIETCNVL